MIIIFKNSKVTVEQPGSVHDSTMFKDSGFGKKCAAGAFGEGFLLGDSGYACTPYLLTPNNAPKSPSEVYYIFNLLFKNVIRFSKILFIIEEV